MEKNKRGPKKNPMRLEKKNSRKEIPFAEITLNCTQVSVLCVYNAEMTQSWKSKASLMSAFITQEFIQND